MKQGNQQFDPVLDRITAEIRNETLDAATVETAAERVWQRVSNGVSTEQVTQSAEAAPAYRINGCHDFQTLIPAYLRRELSEARALLLEDHTRECIPCRRALKETRSANNQATKAVQPNRHIQRTSVAVSPAMRWAIAAALVIGIGLLASPLMQRLFYSGGAGNILVETANGSVYRVSDTESHRVSPGEDVGRGERIRTAKESGAIVKLADSSLIEMRERSEFSVTESSRGTTINLERGQIIVQAAKQRSRHLYVATNDSLVSVTGTIFSVNSGTKGSRVSVVEGEVHVDHNGKNRVLHPGDQVATHASLEPVAVKDEVAWSRNAERYSELLAEVQTLRRELNEKVSRPELRYTTRLLDMVPEGTVLYAALPNLSQSLSESYRMMQERIRQNPTLREWWEQENGRSSSERQLKMNQLVERIREWGEHLGSEIIISAGIDGRDGPQNLLMLTELKNPEGFRAFLEKQIETLAAETKNQAVVRIIADPLTATPQSEPAAQAELLVWMHDDLLAAAPKLASLQQLAAALKAPATNRFPDASFYKHIAELYREGAGLIVAADLQKIVAHSMRERDDPSADARHKSVGEASRQLGLLNLQHFIVEMKETNGKTNNRAVLTFDEPHRGVASWLAAPGPMGALEFISPDANMVTAFVVREPSALVNDLLGALETIDPDLARYLKEFEAEHGVSVRQDFAQQLGGEFAFAVDGPLLPTPSWKMIFEVYDPIHLQRTFEQMVKELNQWAAKEGKAGFEWELGEVSGRTFYTLRSVDLNLAVHYTYTNGYLVITPSRALADRAIRYRESDYTLLRSPRFTASLPEDGNANFSALLYHNLATVLEPLARRLPDKAKMPEGGPQTLRSLATGMPALAYAYAQDDRIIFATGGEGDAFGLTPANLLGLPGSFGIGHIFREATRE
ncbi:MAG: FecR domain-containing protein [Pyrinomonadaceae bacterium]|nr:FecR domain-containing protein [Pyrinomonadaceae bacterium]